MNGSVGEQPAPSGVVAWVKTYDEGKVRDDALRKEEARMAHLRKVLVRDDTIGHFRPSRERLLLENERPRSRWRQEALAWLREHVHRGIPRAYYDLVLGHDLHLSTYGELHYTLFHATERDPWTGRMGWLENVGLSSRGKVTQAFRNFEVDQLIAETSVYGDFKFHEVGTSTQAEANTDTALITTSGIARATGTQVEAAADQYRSVATVVADATETWNEHGIFSASTGATLADRSIVSPAPSVVSLDEVEFTYTMTKNAEA